MNLSNENIIHVKDNDVEYIQFKRLIEYENNISHCYTLIKDYKDNINNNYKKLFNSLGLDYKGFKNINHQAHTNIVSKVSDINDTFTGIDGLVTNKKGISLSIRLADCTPILLYDSCKNVIGNLHSGWRGTTKKIAINGVQKMVEEYNSNPKDIIACIGPCIGKCHFKVDEDVKDIFKEKFSYLLDSNKFVTSGEIEDGKQKYYIDATIINIELLKEAGLLEKNIVDSKICTVCNSNIMHSYRKNKELAGRNTSIIGLR